MLRLSFEMDELLRSNKLLLVELAMCPARYFFCTLFEYLVILFCVLFSCNDR